MCVERRYKFTYFIGILDVQESGQSQAPRSRVLLNWILRGTLATGKDYVLPHTNFNPFIPPACVSGNYPTQNDEKAKINLDDEKAKINLAENCHNTCEFV